MFSILWLLIRIATALAVLGLVASTASARGIGAAIAIWFLLPPGMLVGWLGVSAAFTVMSDLAYMAMEQRSAERQAQIPGRGKKECGMAAVHTLVQREVVRRNQQLRSEQAALACRDAELERIHAAHRAYVHRGVPAALATVPCPTTTAILERITEATGPDERLILRWPVETNAPQPHLLSAYTLPQFVTSETIARRTR